MFTGAKWIRCPEDIGSVSPEFRRKLNLKKEVEKITAYVSAAGVYDLLVDGRKKGNAFMAPGWTSYKNRLQYQEYDLTPDIKDGSVVSVLCGKGWAVGDIGHKTGTNSEFSDNIAAIAAIVIVYRDGSEERVVTDDTWEVYTSQILDSEIYHGETFDLTVEPVFVGKAAEDKTIKTNIVPQDGEYISEHERVAAKKYIVTPKGERVIDFGQNLAGYVEIKIKGRRGDRIVITHAEVLDAEGNFYTENLRAARNRNIYVLSGGDDVFKPHFSFQGYRYIRLDEFPDVPVNLENFTSVAVYSDIERTGYFECGNAKINQLYSNVIWGQRSNFLDVPTDCPQRNERLGWTGDAGVFVRTAAINYNVHKFFKKWLRDAAVEQGADGSVLGVIPAVTGCGGRISAGWGDAACICPWEIYLAYGDKEMLRENFPLMKKWVDYIRSFGDEEYLWLGGRHYGDWLALDGDGDVCEGATQTDLIASAYFYYSATLLVKAGKVLGEDVSEYEKLLINIKDAFRTTFMKDGLPVLYPKYDGLSKSRIVKGLTQTSIVLILAFGLYEDGEEKLLADTLEKMIREFGMRMTTGFLGTPFILHALTKCGKTDIAYNLLLQEACPSWLYSVNNGATTMWEHWDSRKEDGSFWSVRMNSFNHYAYGSVYDWIFGKALGIMPDEDGAGYKKITIAPHPDKRLGFASGSIMTAHGRISVRWYYFEDTVRYEISVPCGVTANIKLPGGAKRTISGETVIMFD